MRLPQQLLESRWFLFSSEEEFLTALGGEVTDQGRSEITWLGSRLLPPVVSVEALAVMLGINPGIIWSFINRTPRYYRTFTIPKGKGERTITAPRVGLKIIQKWLGHHFAKAIRPMSHIYGFVPGRSHIDAAFVHSGAEWALSVDIENFFQSTPRSYVKQALEAIGYAPVGAELISRLACLHDRLAQGAPSSPVLSNLCFDVMDLKLVDLSEIYQCRLSRYADDIVFSGKGEMPPKLRLDVHDLFSSGPWRLSPQKERVEPIKGRIKVHGLIVNGSQVRLTKGYRNKIRAYEHVLNHRGADSENYHILRGHVNYKNLVDSRIANLIENPQLSIYGEKFTDRHSLTNKYSPPPAELASPVFDLDDTDPNRQRAENGRISFAKRILSLFKDRD